MTDLSAIRACASRANKWHGCFLCDPEAQATVDYVWRLVELIREHAE